MPARISVFTKHACIKSIDEGYSITEISKTSGISRISLYSWRKTLTQQLALKGSKQEGSILSKKEKVKEARICKLAVQYPGYSSRKISQAAKLNHSYTWKVLKKHALSKREDRLAKHYKLIKRSRRLSVNEKLSIINSYTNGNSVARICVKINISRTTFYTIYKRYHGVKAKNSMLESSYPKGRAHYRHRRGVERHVLHAVIKRPERSVRSLATEVSRKNSVSPSLVYSVLRKHNLHHVQARRKYKSENKFIVIHDLRLLTAEAMKDIQLGDLQVPQLSEHMLKQFAYGVVFPVAVVGSVTILLNSGATTSGLISRTFTANEENLLEVPFDSAGKILSFNVPVKEDYSQHSGEWGAIAFNSSQSVYLPSETVHFGLTQLDAEGSGICDTNAHVEIIDPGGHRSIYSTLAGNLHMGAECGYRTVTSEFDHSLSYKPTKEGKYDAVVSFDGPEGRETSNTSFYVVEKLPLVVAREAATRIWPQADYPMTIRIKALQAFEGEVRESLPAGFTVRPGKSFEIEKQADKQILTWQVSMKEGEEKVLEYAFDAPDISPAFFAIPPVSIWKHDGSLLFREARSWQMAIDSL